MIDANHIAEAVHEEMIALAGENGRYRTAGLDEPNKIFSELSRNFPAPTVRQLEAVISETFWASLLKDEGRPLEFRLGLYEPGDILNQVHFHDFEVPVPFKANEIKRLAAGVIPNEGFLAVQFEGDTPMIAGIGTHPRYIYKLPFMIHAIPNGELRFTWLSNHVAHFHDGFLDLLSEEPIKYAGLFKGFLDAIGFDETDDVDALRILGHAVETVRSHGHGGSIWMLGKGIDLDDKVDVKYRTSSRHGAESIVGENNGFKVETHWSASIGQMSAIDGAVVLGPGAELVGFGAFIEIGENSEVWIQAKGGGWTKKTGREVGGGRHRSAISFCRNHQPSLAVVVSQDSGMSVVTSGRMGRVVLTPWTPLGPVD